VNHLFFGLQNGHDDNREEYNLPQLLHLILKDFLISFLFIVITQPLAFLPQKGHFDKYDENV